MTTLFDATIAFDSPTTDLGAFIAYFSPPVVTDVPPVLPEGDPDQTGPAYRLFRYYSPRPRGLNVYIYAAGSPMALAEGGQVSETDPYAIYDSRGVAISDGWEDVEMVFWGGHEPVPVTSAQGALLTAAGYTITYPHIATWNDLVTTWNDLEESWNAS